MNYDFDTCVDRSGLGNMKDMLRNDQMRADGVEAFCAAEMDFKTAPCILKALHNMVDRGIFGFTVQTAEYNERIRWWMENSRDWQISPDWIVPAYGTIFSVATSIRLFCGPEDGIIVMTPVYYRYEQAATRLHRRTTHCPLMNDGKRFSIDFAALEQAMADPHNRLLVLCNPHNPTGNVWGREELERIAALSVKYGVYVFSDEIFADDVFGGKRVTSYGEIEAGWPYALVCTGLGKSFNYTGVNHADLIIPDAALRERFRAQRDADHFGSIGPFEYTSVISAFTPEGLSWQRASRAYMEENARIVKDFFAERLAPNVVYPMEGCYIAFIEWRGLKLTGEELHRFLEDEAQLVLEPGDHYGDGYGRFSRISLGSTHEQTIAALERAEAAIRRHPEICEP